MSISSAELTDGIFLSIEAYSSNFGIDAGLSGAGIGDGWHLLSRDDLGLTGFLNGLYFIGDFRYSHLDGQAIVAQKGDTLSIAFEGTGGFSDLPNLIVDGALPATIALAYSRFDTLVAAVDDYLSSHSEITHVMVTGHSLGGSMAEMFMYEHAGSQYQAITFGSPGISNYLFQGEPIDNRVLNVSHVEDPIPLAPGMFSTGQPLSIDLANSINLTLSAHASSKYQASIQELTQSTLFSSYELGTQVTIGDVEFNDQLDGKAVQKNFLIGLSGDDVLRGGSANDLLDGGSGADHLIGNGGEDILSGGKGSDTFVFDGSIYAGAPLGAALASRITDFEPQTFFNYGDLIDISALLFNSISGHATSTLVRAREDPGQALSLLQIDPSAGTSDADWMTIARLDKTYVGDALKVILDQSQTPELTATIYIEPAGGNLAPATTWSISPSSPAVNEGDVVNLTISRSDNSTEQTVYISTTINHGSLNEGDYDYWLNVPHTFQVGASSFLVPIQTHANGVAEGDETFGLIVQQSSSDPASVHLPGGVAEFTIHDIDTPSTPGPGITWTSTDIDHSFTGTPGNDTATGISGNNTLLGNDGNDYLSVSGGGTNYLSSGSGDDQLLVAGGNNTLLGGDGNDYIQVTAPGSNIIDGGAGIDTLYYYQPGLTDSVTVNLVANANTASYAFSLPDGTSVSNVELFSLITGSGNDQVTFNTLVPGSQYWDGGGGNDTAILDFSAFSGGVGASPSSFSQEQITAPGGGGYNFSLSNVENLTLYGGSGNDSLSGGSNDTFFGNDGNDYLSVSGGGTNYLSSGSGDDQLLVAGGNNTLLGGDGNDYIQVTAPGSNIIDGGAGIDTLYYYQPGLTDSVTVNLVANANTASYAFSLPDGTSVSNVELFSLITGSGNDQVTFNTLVPGSQYWDGGGGNDTAILDFSAFSGGVGASPSSFSQEQITAPGGGGYNFSLSNVENLTLYGGSGNDSLSGGSNDTFFGNDGNDYLSVSGGGTNYLSSGSGDDQLLVAGGNNTLLGGDGNDYIQVTAPGSNIIDGGAGIDTLYYYQPGLTDSVTVNLVANANTASYAFSLPDGTSVSNVELFSLITGSGNDQVTFNTLVPGSQYWDGGGGNDTAILDFSAFSGGVGASPSSFSQEQITAPGGGGYNFSLSNVENLTLYGGSGNDSLSGGSNDTFFGNDGNDYLSVSGGGANYLSSGSGDDQLLVAGGNNTLLGGDGNDYIQVTAPGSNIIDGGAGIDTLYYYQPGLTDSVTVNLVANANTASYAFSLPDGTSVSNVELFSLITGSGNDQVTFNTLVPGSQYWDGGGGNDTAILDFSAFSGGVGASPSSFSQEQITAPGGGGYNFSLSNVENLTLYGGSGNDSLSGGSNDTFFGNDGNDYLSTGSGNDYLSGGPGNDYLSSGDGADTLDGGGGDDTLDGGPGTDTASYASATGHVTVSLSIFGPQNAFGDGVDTLVGIENLTGSTFADTLNGDANPNVLSSGIEGDWAGETYRLYEATLARQPDPGGFDFWIGQLRGGMSLTTAASGFTGSPEFQSTYGSLDDTQFVTLLYNNVLHRAPDPGGLSFWLNRISTGESRSDVVLGFSESPEDKGNQQAGVQDYVHFVTPSEGNVLDGGTGTDTASYASALGGVTVSLGIPGPQETFGAGIDTLANIENLTGSSFDDKLTGDANPNVLSGGPGNDILDSSGGLEHDWSGQAYRLYETTLDRGPDPGGFDYWITQLHDGMSLNAAAAGFTGSPEFQSTYGSLDDTQFVTLLYNNALHRAPDPDGLAYWVNLLGTGTPRGGIVLGFSESPEQQQNSQAGLQDFVHFQDPSQANVLAGGDGTDTASYASATGGVTVSLAVSGPQETFGAGVDTLVNIENLIGSTHADTLSGDINPNALTGSGGGDTMKGHAGEALNPTDATTYVYQATTDSNPGPGNFDTITDFAPGVDKIDLSAIKGLTAVASAFSVPATIAPNTIEIVTSGGNTVIYANATAVPEATGSADMEIHLTGVTGLTNVTSADLLHA